jgi:hypothetical protein
MTVYRSEVTVLICPLIPDRDTVVLEVLDICIACDEPEKFVNDGLEVHLLGCEKRESLAQVKTHLMTEYALGTGAGTVAFHCSVFTDMTKEI